MEGYIGQVILFAGTFAPRGWAFCQGQLLSIAQNTALFAILGTTYGGNGQTTFALPDLRGRTPVGAGQGPGLGNKSLGQMGGEEAHTLLASEMPAHNHVLNGTNADQTTNRPGGALPAKGGAYGTSPNTTLAAGALGTAGGSQAHNNLPPYLGLNYIICLEGIFPSRN
jgi:microcystin-dependent protein